MNLARAYGVKRRSRLPFLYPLGSEWKVRCPHCLTRGKTLGEGKCVSCGQVVFENNPTIEAHVEARTRVLSALALVRYLFTISLPVTLSFFVWIPLNAFYFTSVSKWLDPNTHVVVEAPSLYSMFLWTDFILPMSFLGSLGVLLLGAPVTVQLFQRCFERALADWQRQFPAGGRAPGSLKRISIVSVECNQGAERPISSVRVTVCVKPKGLNNDTLSLSVRLRGPDGHYVRGKTEDFQGDLGEFLANVKSRSIPSGSRETICLETSLPLANMTLPRLEEVNLFAIEVVVHIRDKIFFEGERELVL